MAHRVFRGNPPTTPALIAVSWMEFDVPAPPYELIEASGVAPVHAVGEPAVTIHGTIAASGVATRAAVGQPAASSTLQIDATGVASRAAVGEPAAGSVMAVEASGVASVAAIGQPAAGSEIEVDVEAEGVASVAAVGEPAVDTSATVNVSASSVESVAAVGEPVAESTLDVAPEGVASVATVGEPAVESDVPTLPTGVASRAAIGRPYVAQIGMDDFGTGGVDGPPGPHAVPRRGRYVKEEGRKAPIPAVNVLPPPAPPLEAVVDTAALQAAREGVAQVTAQAREAVELAEAAAWRQRVLRLVLLVDAMDD